MSEEELKRVQQDQRIKRLVREAVKEELDEREKALDERRKKSEEEEKKKRRDSEGDTLFG